MGELFLNPFCIFLFIPVNVVRYEWKVEEYREPFPSQEEENIYQDMENILWQNQRIQTVALIDRIFVISFKLIESNNLKHERFSSAQSLGPVPTYVKYWEKKEESVDDESSDVGECSKCEGHR